MNYETWNLQLAQHFFNEEMAGRQVLLYANEALIQKVGGSEAALQDFIAAIKTGPSGATRSGLCQRALQAFDRWSQKASSYPPYLAYLVFFVIAAGTDEEDFAPHAYYPRLWRLLGEEAAGNPPSFDRMIDLWSDLEKWSREDRHEELGRFVASPRGKWIHVGMPLSQKILSDDERRLLPVIFARADLDPTAAPATEILVRELVAHGRELLGRQTLRLLRSTSEDDNALREGLADFVLEELSQWDGEVPEGALPAEAGRTRFQTGLRLCLEINTFSKAVRAYLRFRATRPFPVGGLTFDTGTNGTSWTCTESYQGWSTPITSGTSPVDASALDWKRGYSIADSENEWRARLRPAQVRLFFLGKHDGLPGWVETHRLQREREFLVLCTERAVAPLEAWGTTCGSFSPQELRGLPAGWRAFSGKGATASCPDVDVLTLAPSARLLLRGGIRTGRGNTYFDFGRPTIIVENFSAMPRVTLNGKDLKPRSGSGDAPVWDIPNGQPLLTPLVVEAHEAVHVLKKVVRLQAPQLASSWDSVPWRDQFGRLTSASAEIPLAQGAAVSSVFVAPPLPAKPHLPTYLSHRIAFLGHLPGQIAEWPEERVPTDWQPTWALARRDKEHWDAHFCGTEDSFTGSPIGAPLSDHAVIKRWKRYFWNLRKVVSPPSLARVQRLWKTFVEAAENV